MEKIIEEEKHRSSIQVKAFVVEVLEKLMRKYIRGKLRENDISKYAVAS